MAKLTKEEKKVADDFAKGLYKKKKDTRDFASMAATTKEARINLRLSDEVLNYFKLMAEKEGIPYQTLINSALYKIATGQMVDQKDADLIKMIEKLENKISKIAN